MKRRREGEGGREKEERVGKRLETDMGGLTWEDSRGRTDMGGLTWEY